MYKARKSWEKWWCNGSVNINTAQGQPWSYTTQQPLLSYKFVKALRIVLSALDRYTGQKAQVSSTSWVSHTAPRGISLRHRSWSTLLLNNMGNARLLQIVRRRANIFWYLLHAVNEADSWSKSLFLVTSTILHWRLFQHPTAGTSRMAVSSLEARWE